MKTCTVWGDMLSDRTSDQYPTVTVCDACVEKHQQAGKDSKILSVNSEYDSLYGEECYFCEKTKEEEDAE